jgi:SAM-dependent methyltransferase
MWVTAQANTPSCSPQLGYDVLGIDYSSRAVEQARENAAAKGVDAHFEVADAMNLGESQRYDTIVDSALFHIFDDADRATYVRSLHGAVRPGGLVHVLALSDAGRGFGPSVSEAVIRDAFTDGWTLEALDTTIYRGIVQEGQADALGLPVGQLVEEPAWLARVRRA